MPITVKSPYTGEHITFNWGKKSPPTSKDIANIEAGQRRAMIGLEEGRLQDPANKSLLSPSRWASMIPQGLLSFGGADESYLPESQPLQAGQLIPQAPAISPESAMMPGFKPTEFRPATPLDVGIYGAGRDIYENAIRPAATPLGMAATLAGGAIAKPIIAGATAANRNIPLLQKALAHGAAAAMAPSTVESVGAAIQDPTLENVQGAALGTGFQMLGGAGQLATRQPRIAPPAPVLPPQQKLLGPGTVNIPGPPPFRGQKLLDAAPEPGTVELPRPLKAPARTPKRETILNNRLKALEKQAQETGDLAQSQKIMDEVGAVERELEQLKGQIVERPETVKVSDKRSVAGTEEEISPPKPSKMRISEPEEIPVRDLRTQVDEPAPRGLPEAYKGFSREGVIKERGRELFQESAKPQETFETTPIEPPRKKAKLDKEVLEQSRTQAAEKQLEKVTEKLGKKKKGNVAEDIKKDMEAMSGKIKKVKETYDTGVEKITTKIIKDKYPKKEVLEPGYEKIESGYQLKKFDDGRVAIKSPTGEVETFANERFARAHVRKRTKEDFSLGPDEEAPGKKVTSLDSEIEQAGKEMFEEVRQNKGPKIGKRFRVSKMNPSRIFLDQDLMDAYYSEVRGKKTSALGATQYVPSSKDIMAAERMQPGLGRAIAKIRQTGKPLELVGVGKRDYGNIGMSTETARHESGHAVIAELKGLNRYIDKDFLEHPVYKKLQQDLPSSYPPEKVADEIFVNAVSGGMRRRDITPNMLGNLLRDPIERMIDKNPENGYKILKTLNPKVREAVIYGGNPEFTRKTGRGYAQWKRKFSGYETHMINQGIKKLRDAGVTDLKVVKESIQTAIDKISDTTGLEHDFRLPPDKAEKARLFDEAMSDFMLTGKWDKDKVPEGFYNYVTNAEKREKQKALPPAPNYLEPTNEKGMLRLSVIEDTGKLVQGAWDELLGSMRNVLRRQGPSGRKFSTKFERMRTNERMIGEEWNSRFDKIIKTLSKPERDNLVDVIHGTAQPMNPVVDFAAQQTRILDTEVQARAHIQGLAFNDPWAQTKDMNAMHEYLIDAAKRIAKSEEFGGPHVIDNLIQGAKDPKKMRQLVHYLFDNMSYARQSQTGKKISHGLAKLEAASKLTYFVISNVNNLMPIALHGSLKNLAQGIHSSFTSEGRRFAKSSGALWEATRHEILDIGKSEGFTLTKALGISASERWQRTIAAGAGRAAAKDYFKRLKKNPNDLVARRQLNELVLDPGGAGNLLQQTKLTDHQLKKAGARMAELTQGIAEKYDLPHRWTTSSWAAIPLMFKRYAHVGTNNIIRAIRVDPIRNIPKAILLSQVFGELTGDLKKGLQGAFEGAANDENILQAALEKIKERGQWRKGNWEKDPALDEQTIGAIKRIYDNAIQSWFLGMPGDVIEAAALKGQSGLLEFLAGPSISRAAKFAGTLSETTRTKGLEEGIAKTAKEQLKEVAPLPVRPFLDFDEQRERKLQRPKLPRIATPMPQ